MNEDIERRLDQLDKLAYALENLIPIPGTDIRFGIDAIAGFVPVLGDTIMIAPASVIVREAHKMGAPRRLLIRMGLNLGVDMLVGMIPLVGDIFDIGWNANTRNVRLLRGFVQAIPDTTSTPKPLAHTPIADTAPNGA